MLLYQGMRRDEVRLLRWPDITESHVVFVAKGRVERELWLHAVARATLTRWREQCASAEWVFPSPMYPDQPVGRTSVGRHLRIIGQRAGVDRFHAHRGRHTFARQMIDGGVPVPHVQEALGHISLASTQVYTAAGSKEVAQAIATLDY